MRALLRALVPALAAVVLSAGSAQAMSVYPSGATGVDVSYPNCSARIPHVAFGIVGVTGGLVYSQNSCLAAEAAHFANLSLYVNTGLNADPVGSAYYRQAQVGCNGDVYCAAYNYGYNAAQSAIDYAGSQGVHAAWWWLDVETGNTWNGDTLQNRRSLQGEYDALAASGATVGAYSTTYQWNTITGSWLSGWPNWGATTVRTASQAARYCSGHQFTGGTTYLIQYSGKLDQDYAC